MDVKKFNCGKSGTFARNLDTKSFDGGNSGRARWTLRDLTMESLLQLRGIWTLRNLTVEYLLLLRGTWPNFVFNWKSGTIIRDTRKFDSGMSGTRNLDNKKLSSRKHPESGHQEV